MIIRGIKNIDPFKQGCVVTIGNFDGVHCGHQALLAQLKAKAAELGVPAVVVTFEPHPQEFFMLQKSPPRLSRLREKYYELQQLGIDKILVLRFDEKFAQLSASDFIQKVLVDKLAAKHVLVGDDFHFGNRREGDYEFLSQVGKNKGFTTAKMPTFLLDNERVSSTLVRKALAQADHKKVKKLLGHPYYMMGKVVHGDKLGRLLGFPTANIHLHRAVTPVHGIYTVRLIGIGKDSLPGVANVGIRPTVGGTRTLLEVHLFDFDQDIYGKQVKVEFGKKLRDEERYDNLELLKEKINQDVTQAKAYFKKGEE